MFWITILSSSIFLWSFLLFSAVHKLFLTYLSCLTHSEKVDMCVRLVLRYLKKREGCPHLMKLLYRFLLNILTNVIRFESIILGNWGKVWSKKIETQILLYCSHTIQCTKMVFKSADTLEIRLSEMVQYINVHTYYSSWDIH